MTGYILSILGIVVAGIFIDIIVPDGTINKYVKSIYSIFVVAVILSPIVKLISKKDIYTLQHEDYQVNEKLMNYIQNQKVKQMENKIKAELESEGFKNLDIKINYSTNSNELSLISCEINLKKLSIDADKQHINKYEFIAGVVKENTNLLDEVILFYEWR